MIVNVSDGMLRSSVDQYDMAYPKIANVSDGTLCRSIAQYDMAYP